MNMLQLTLANMRYKPLNTLFHVLLLAVGVATIMAISHVNTQMDRQFQKDLRGIDLVVSGKGSPLQIILSSVFHLDIPTGNIPAAEADKLRSNNLVKQAIPLALGDNYNGFRIVGTNKDYIDHYQGKLATGALYTAAMQAVIGGEVARKFNLHIGDKIVGAHGLVNSDDLHTDFPYTVTGILEANGTVLDRLVLTPVESVWHVHEHPDADDPEEVAYKQEHPENEITALLISYKSPMAAVTLPRLINKNSSMQAASPAFEVARLNNIMNAGGDLLRAFGGLMIGFAAFGVFVTLFNAVMERRYDLVLLRTLGATRAHIMRLMVIETVLLGACGVVVGCGLAALFMRGATLWISMTKHLVLENILFEPMDALICGGALLVALLAGLIPAWRAYRLNIVEILQRP